MAANQDLNVVVKLVDKASKDLKKMSDRFNDFGDSVKDQTEQARSFTTAATGLGVVVWGLAVNEFANFEKTMSGVNAVLAPTNQEFEQLTNLAIEQGRTTAFTAQEAAAGIEMLAKNGLDAASILGGGLAQSMALASAGAVDLSTAADISTDVMALWKMEANELGIAVNGITWVMQNSKFTVDDFRLALAQGWGVASAVGVEFSDFTTTIAGIAPYFASGSDAGTSFKVMLQRLVPQSEGAAEAMKTLGIITEDGTNRFFDAAGNMQDMATISGILQEGLKDLSDEQKNEALATIFGTDAMRAAVGLSELWADSFEKLQGKIESVDAKEAAAKRLDNLKGKLTLLRSAISGIMIEVGSRLAPVIESSVVMLTDLITNFSEKWAELSPNMQKVVTIAGAVTAGIVGLTIAVGALGLVLPVIATWLGAISAALAFLTWPIGLVVAWVAGLAFAWKNNFLGIQEATAWAVAVIKPLFDTIVEAAVSLYTGVSEWVNRISEPIIQVFNFLQPYIESVLSNIASFFGSTFQNIITAVQGAFNVLSWVIELAFIIIGWAIELGLNLITWNWRGAWDTIKNITSWVADAMRQIISGALTFLGAVIRQFGTTAKLLFTTTWTAIKVFLAWIFEGIKLIFTSSFDLIVNIVKAGGDLLGAAWDGTMQGMKTVTLSIWDGIKQAIANGINWVIDKINYVIKKANSVSDAIGGPQISPIARLEFEKGGIVPGFQTGGIVAGGKNPANHDQVPAMLDPGELILNRAQQKNLASQMSNTGGQAVYINVNIWNNSFYGDDEELATRLADTITENIKQNLAINAF